MELSERSVGDVKIIDLKGQIVHGDEGLHEKVKGFIDGGNRKIVLNFAGVSYVDSTGLGYLVSCYTTAKNGDAKLKLANLTSRLRDLLSITKLLTVFDSFDTEDEAIQSFG